MQTGVFDMTGNTEILYWRSNEEWYEDDPTDEYIFRVKNNAPERAKKSFELWKIYQEPRYTEKELMD